MQPSPFQANIHPPSSWQHTYIIQLGTIKVTIMNTYSSHTAFYFLGLNKATGEPKKHNVGSRGRKKLCYASRCFLCALSTHRHRFSLALITRANVFYFPTPLQPRLLSDGREEKREKWSTSCANPRGGQDEWMRWMDGWMSLHNY